MRQAGGRAGELNRFLGEVEKTAFHLARYAVRDSEEALDIVQDVMFTLARKYGHRPVAEWRPLFFRILQNRIRDWHRRSIVRQRWLSEATLNGFELEELATDGGSGDPAKLAVLDGAAVELRVAVLALPLRQQQTFLLRAIEGMNVTETAHAMKCSQGTVKTHYSRAVHALRAALEEHWHDGN